MALSWRLPCWLRSPALVAGLITLGCLTPFVGKAFHIDDPLFLWAAKHIQTHPTDFYNFSVHWYFTEEPMANVTKNPPGTSYYIAAVAALFGWSELALHVAFLLPALGVIGGTYCLAQRFCAYPLVAALATLLTPVFLVSSTNVMCDTMMLCFWVWAIVLWEYGLQREQRSLLLLSGLLVSVCALTKYFGVSLIPLLLAYSLARRQSLWLWLPALLLPVVILIGYEEATRALYGHGLLRDAGTYAKEFKLQIGSSPLPENLLTGLAFAGGCIASVAFYLPLIWSWRALGGWLGLIVSLILLLGRQGAIGARTLNLPSQFDGLLVSQFALSITAGCALLALAGVDLLKRHNPSSLLLLLWVTGTFIFAVGVNWTTNARSLLPLAPAAGILLARRLESLYHSKPLSLGHWRKYVPLVPAGLLSLAVAWADFRLANSARQAATELHARFAGQAANLWFEGHWGFQYYMQELGGKAVDVRRSVCRPGDLFIIPRNNSNTFLPRRLGPQVGLLEMMPCPWLSTMSIQGRAGFYTSLWGPLPFTFGPMPPERYGVFSITTVLQPGASRSKDDASKDSS